MRLSLAFSRIADLCMALGEHPLNQYAGCWERHIDEHWWIAVNGHGEPRNAGTTPQEVPPRCAYVEFNGWPAGVIPVNGNGGWLAAGSLANEDELIAALDRAIECCQTEVVS